MCADLVQSERRGRRKRNDKVTSHTITTGPSIYITATPVGPVVIICKVTNIMESHPFEKDIIK